MCLILKYIFSKNSSWNDYLFFGVFSFFFHASACFILGIQTFKVICKNSVHIPVNNLWDHASVLDGPRRSFRVLRTFQTSPWSHIVSRTMQTVDTRHFIWLTFRTQIASMILLFLLEATLKYACEKFRISFGILIITLQ